MKSNESDATSAEPDSGLSERQERLLMRVADGQVGFFDRRRASALLEKSAAARNFVDGIRNSGALSRVALLNSADSDLRTHEVDLWGRISRRIEEEERAELMLGRRVTDERERAPLGWFERLGFDRLAWGLTGGMVAASLTVFILRQPPSAARDQQNFSVASLPLPHVAFNNTERSLPAIAPVSTSAPVSFSSAEHNVVEVDWMRSDGRVRLMQDPSERSAIIWIKRRDIPRAVEAAQRRGLGLAATGFTVTPSLQIPGSETGR
jgi:hypothetical protein